MIGRAFTIFLSITRATWSCSDPDNSCSQSYGPKIVNECPRLSRNPAPFAQLRAATRVIFWAYFRFSHFTSYAYTHARSRPSKTYPRPSTLSSGPLVLVLGSLSSQILTGTEALLRACCAAFPRFRGAISGSLKETVT